MTRSATGRLGLRASSCRLLSPTRVAQFLALLTVLTLILPWPAAAAIIQVTGSCTLVAAINAANDNDDAGGLCTSGSGSDEIRLTADVTLTQVDNTASGGPGTSGGPNGLPVVDSVIVIEGNGHTLARAAGAPAFRIISVETPSGDLTLQNITLTNGGGATFDYLGGAISAVFTSTLSVIDSTIADNSAGGFNGGAGGINNGSNSVTITGTTISGNSAYVGGGMLNTGISTITNSTLSGNTGGTDKGGAIDNTGTVTVINSTFSGNSAGASGAGAINVFSGEARLKNTLLADNSPVNCTTGSGSVVDNLGNLADDDSCDMIPDTLSGLDAVLADNGGPTRTHALSGSSGAIDLAGTCGLSTDQRGAPRPAGDCDSGAYEYIDCPDQVLDYDTVSGPLVRENCQRILTGPDFIVMGSGDLVLRAGSIVILGNDTEVDPGGKLTVEIDPDLQLVPPM